MTEQRGRELRDQMIDQNARIERCRSCHAPIWWGITAAQKLTPFDVFEGQRTAVTHFSTCPDAALWSKR
ncbi:MAG TPA: hypothetical protein VFB50_02505 [Chloroflexota bacterium]|nr:hypothetical protein [Chloroflexota bacterium]